MTRDTLKKLVAEAERQDEEQTLENICAAVGIGVRTLQHGGRSADTARRRAVVAWVLHERLHWTQVRTAKALHVSPRAVRKMMEKVS